MEVVVTLSSSGRAPGCAPGSGGGVCGSGDEACIPGSGGGACGSDGEAGGSGGEACLWGIRSYDGAAFSTTWCPYRAGEHRFLQQYLW